MMPYSEGNTMQIQRLSLRTATDCRRFLQRIAVALVNEQIDPKTANSITSLVNVVLSSIRIDEQQRRIDEIERLLTEESKAARYA